MRTPPELFIVSISLSGIVFGVFAYSMLRKIRKGPETAGARIKLKPGETLKDLHAMQAVDTLLFLALLAYGLSGIGGYSRFLAPLEAVMFVLSLPLVLIFYRVWSRI